MGTRASDLDNALRAAAGIDDADVPRLSSSAITELANETVETIAWTYTDAVASATEYAKHRRRRVALATAVALAVAGGTALTVSGVLNVTSNTSANAGDGVPNTQSMPLRALSAAARQAATACIQQLEPPGNPFPNPHLTLSDPLLYDLHGRVGFVVLANDKDFGSCSILDGIVESGGGAFTTRNGYPHPPATSVSLVTNGTWWTMDLTNKRVDVTVLVGLAGSAVTSVRVLRADGAEVTASMNDGLWAATWLGTSKAVAVAVGTRGGHNQLTMIDYVAVVPPRIGSPSASASGH